MIVTSGIRPQASYWKWLKYPAPTQTPLNRLVYRSRPVGWAAPVIAALPQREAVRRTACRSILFQSHVIHVVDIGRTGFVRLHDRCWLPANRRVDVVAQGAGGNNNQRAVMNPSAIGGDASDGLIECPTCYEGRIIGLLPPMPHEDLQVRGIHHAIAQRRRANVHRRVVLAPGLDEDEQVFDVYGLIPIEVDYGDDRCLPYVAAAEPAGPA